MGVKEERSGTAAAITIDILLQWRNTCHATHACFVPRSLVFSPASSSLSRIQTHRPADVLPSFPNPSSFCPILGLLFIHHTTPRPPLPHSFHPPTHPPSSNAPPFPPLRYHAGRATTRRCGVGQGRRRSNTKEGPADTRRQRASSSSSTTRSSNHSTQPGGRGGRGGGSGRSKGPTTKKKKWYVFFSHPPTHPPTHTTHPPTHSPTHPPSRPHQTLPCPPSLGAATARGRRRRGRGGGRGRGRGRGRGGGGGG